MSRQLSKLEIATEQWHNWSYRFIGADREDLTKTNIESLIKAALVDKAMSRDEAMGLPIGQQLADAARDGQITQAGAYANTITATMMAVMARRIGLRITPMATLALLAISYEEAPIYLLGLRFAHREVDANDVLEFMGGRKLTQSALQDCDIYLRRLVPDTRQLAAEPAVTPHIVDHWVNMGVIK